jgi:hypothetical protein
MVVKFFRASFAAQYAVLILTALLLWLPAFLQPVSFISQDDLSPLSHLLSQWLVHLPQLTVGLAFLLMLLQALFFNAILAANQLSLRVGSIGAFIYILLMSQSIQQTAMYDYLLAALFILAALHTILLMQNTENTTYYLFNAGIFISLASLFYFPAIILFVWLWLSLFILRIQYLREWGITMVGLITPYFFLASWYYLTDQLFWRFEAYTKAFERFGRIDANFTWLNGLVWGVVLVLVVLSLSIVYGQSTEKNVSIRKKIGVNTWLFIISILFIFNNLSSINRNGLIFIPLGIYIAYYLSFAKKLFWPQLLLLLLIALIAVTQYLYLAL